MRGLALLGVASFAMSGCGGMAAADVSRSPDAGSSADASAPRVPQKHRASSSVCPSERGASGADAGQCDDAGFCECSRDADCTAGSNGRCEFARCYYDDCFSDSDCPNNRVCQCRGSASDLWPNTCETTGNCRVDADCGPGGYCSPSHVGDRCVCLSAVLCSDASHCSPGPCVCGDSCGHGYYCHTTSDTCIDDNDCKTGGTCSYDTLSQHFQCASCWPVP